MTVPHELIELPPQREISCGGADTSLPASSGIGFRGCAEFGVEEQLILMWVLQQRRVCARIHLLDAEGTRIMGTQAPELHESSSRAKQGGIKALLKLPKVAHGHWRELCWAQYGTIKERKKLCINAKSYRILFKEAC